MVKTSNHLRNSTRFTRFREQTKTEHETHEDRKTNASQHIHANVLGPPHPSPSKITHVSTSTWTLLSKKQQKTRKKQFAGRRQRIFWSPPDRLPFLKTRWPWDFFQHWVSHWHHGDHPFKDDRQGSTPPRQRGAIQHYPSLSHDRI